MARLVSENLPYLQKGKNRWEEFIRLIDKSAICFFSYNRTNYQLIGDINEPQVIENRKTLSKQLNINYKDLVCLKQIHGSNIYIAGSKDKGKGAVSYNTAIDGVDAIATREKNLPICILTADCLSIFFYDAHTSSIGLAHAGWRSTKADITKNLIKKMQDEFQLDPKNLLVGFGPSIRSCCYEISQDVADYFSADSIIKKDGRLYLDLVKENLAQLYECDVEHKNIFDSGICTACNLDKFFSYRVDGCYCGRNISIMMLR